MIIALAATDERPLLRMVVTVKAYPALSTKYGEAVCVAGLRSDSLFATEWVRLFPVKFRDLPTAQQFEKWDEIEVRVSKHGSDNRPESYRPDIQSLRRIGHYSTHANWSARRTLVELLPIRTMCGLIQQQQLDGTSLGLIRPRRPVHLVIRRERAAVVRRRTMLAGQGSLFDPERTPLEPLPYTFSYRYRCEASDCSGHEQQIADWEIGEAYRRWRYRYPRSEDLEAKLRQKWIGDLCSPTRNTMFFVGNLRLYPASFLVLGVFYPKRIG